MPDAPVAPKRPHTHRAHGRERQDPWAWLRSDTRDDPEVLAHLAAENAYLEAEQGHLAGLREALFGEMKARIQEDDLTVPYRWHGWYWAFRTATGRQYGTVERRQVGAEEDAPWEVVLDEDALAGDSDYFSLGITDFSPSTNLVFYGTDHDGSEVHVGRIRDLRTGEDLPDRLEGLYYGSAWAGEEDVVYVTTDEAMRPDKVWRHRLGTSQSEDVLLFDEPDERFFVGVGLTLTERFVEIEVGSKVTSEAWFLDAADLDAPAVCVAARRQGVEYTAVHAPRPGRPDRLLVVTNDAAVDFRLLACDLGDPAERWQVVVPERPGVRLSGVEVFARHTVLRERAEGVKRISLLDEATGAVTPLPMPEEVYSTGYATNAEYDSHVLRFGYTSLVTPSSVYDLDLDTGERTLLKQTPVLGGYDAGRFTSGRTWAMAEDGTRIPISWVHRADVPHDGSAPCLLYGYGSYETSIDPTFSILRLSLLERGVVYAIAHVRGGGELGRRWYEEGKLEHKATTFSDFVACARHLVAEGFASPTRMAARGGSAGGLLMGAVANLAPEEFAAIVAEVPFVDSLTTMLDPTLPLTVTEWEEWGDPYHDEAFYEHMLAYSPYDNVGAKPYPAVLATAGLNDPRVSYWEPAKWVQKLREQTTSGSPVYLKTELGAGHGGPSGRYDAWKDEAFVFAFLLDALGVPPS